MALILDFFDYYTITRTTRLIFSCFVTKNRASGFLLDVSFLCWDPGSNRGPFALQANALPTELSQQYFAQLIAKTPTQPTRALTYAHPYISIPTSTPVINPLEGRGHRVCSTRGYVPVAVPAAQHPRSLDRRYATGPAPHRPNSSDR